MWHDWPQLHGCWTFLLGPSIPAVAWQKWHDVRQAQAINNHLDDDHDFNNVNVDEYNLDKHNLDQHNVNLYNHSTPTRGEV